jgi:dTDP-4-dehydrorhamnose 3,5-epimerase
MQVIDTALPEVKRIALTLRGDARGFFVERFSQAAWQAQGFTENFVQDNHSRSAPGVVRGLHFQYDLPQGKLVGCTSGRILDVAVDVRPHSPNFGKHVAVELNDTAPELLWIPAGFAHGFCVLGDQPADVFYKVTAPYNAKGESGIHYGLIHWPIANPTVSERDAAAPTLAAATEQLKTWFPK